MPPRELSGWRPFISLLIIVGTLLGLVFFKMESRLLSYYVLKQSEELNQLKDKKGLLRARLSRALEPNTLRAKAVAKFGLAEVDSEQVLYLSEPKLSEPEEKP